MTPHTHVLNWIRDHRDQLSMVVHDTRILKAKGIFFDVVGCEQHCHNALAQGACAIITPLSLATSDHRPVFQVDDPRLLFAKACALFYDRQPTPIVAVTGTNGKTSTVDFIRQLWASLHKSAFSFGTLGLQTHAHPSITLSLPTHINTLDAYHMHTLLQHIHNHDAYAHVAFEASSHGLHQHRVSGVRVTCAVWTNLTQDHLDYHGTMDEYFHCKTRLFTEILRAQGTAVINHDDPYGQRLMSRLPKDITPWTYSLHTTHSTLYGVIDSITSVGMHLTLTHTPHDGLPVSVSVHVPVVGRFQAENILAAVAAVLASDNTCGLLDLKLGLENLKSPKGRMEHVGTTASGGDVFVDYAHTPDALKHALQALRAHTQGQLYVVMGCGGDRDTTKRAIMGHHAVEYADVAFITDDNPRTEDPALIREHVMAGAHTFLTHNPTASKAYVIDGRADAIQRGVAALKAGDALLIAGKGHEDYQIMGTTRHFFCDVKTAQDAMRKTLS